MRTKQQYIEGLRKMRRNIYVNGEKIARDDEIQMPTINTIGLTFDLRRQSEEPGPVHGHIPSDRGEDQSVQSHPSEQGRPTQEAGYDPHGFARWPADASSGAWGSMAPTPSITCPMKRTSRTTGPLNTTRISRNGWRDSRREDLVGCCAQTDVKGDRMKRPSEQKDPDLYVHVVEKKSDGIVVRGSKVHISEASVADEILVAPHPGPSAGGEGLGRGLCRSR